MTAFFCSNRFLSFSSLSLFAVGCAISAESGPEVPETTGRTSQAVSAAVKDACAFTYTAVTPSVPSGFSGSKGFAGAGTAYADVTGDGKSDTVAVTALDTVTNYVGSGDGTFTAGPATTLPPPASGKVFVGLGIVASGDFDGDGIADVVVVSTTAYASAPGGTWFGRFVFLYGSAGGTFGSTVQTADVMTSGGGTNIHIARDFDGDGKDDFLYGNFGSQTIMFANAGRTFAAASSVGSGNPGGVTSLGGTPASLFFLSSPTAKKLTWPGRAKTTETLQGPSVTAEVTGDLDGDGKLDIAGKFDPMPNTSIKIGTVDTASATSTFYGFKGYTQLLMAADVVGDGKQELLYNDSDVAYAACGYVPGATDLVAAPLGIPLPYPTSLVRAGDLNGDGKADFFTRKSGVLVAAYLSGPKPATPGGQVTLTSTPPPVAPPDIPGDDAGPTKPGKDGGTSSSSGNPDPGATPDEPGATPDEPGAPASTSTTTTSGCSQTPRTAPFGAAALALVGLALLATARRRRPSRMHQ